MSEKKWGTIRVNSQLVKSVDELTRVWGDPSLNPLLQSLDAGLGGNLPPGYRSLVRGYGDEAAEYVILDGYWPGIDSGVLTINDATAGHEFIVTSTVLTLDDGAAKADASILNPGGVLLVENI